MDTAPISVVLETENVMHNESLIISYYMKMHDLQFD